MDNATLYSVKLEFIRDGTITPPFQSKLCLHFRKLIDLHVQFLLSHVLQVISKL